MDTPYVIHRLHEASSTQDEARARFEDDGPVIVLAERQVLGRGRTGNQWVHAPRATAASVAMRPAGPLGLIPLIAGMVARDTIFDDLGLRIELKWPNDLMRGDDKLGGVLVESGDGIVVVGCGINVWWPDAPAGIGAVSDVDLGLEATLALAEAWGSRLLDAVSPGPAAWDRGAYVAACSTLGREIEWDPAGRGRAVDIGPDGGLVVLTEDGRLTLRSGAVRAVRPATLEPSERDDRGAGTL